MDELFAFVYFCIPIKRFHLQLNAIRWPVGEMLFSSIWQNNGRVKRFSKGLNISIVGSCLPFTGLDNFSLKCKIVYIETHDKVNRWHTNASIKLHIWKSISSHRTDWVSSVKFQFYTYLEFDYHLKWIVSPTNFFSKFMAYKNVSIQFIFATHVRDLIFPLSRFHCSAYGIEIGNNGQKRNRIFNFY